MLDGRLPVRRHPATRKAVTVSSTHPTRVAWIPGGIADPEAPTITELEAAIDLTGYMACVEPLPSTNYGPAISIDIPHPAHGPAWCPTCTDRAWKLVRP